MQAARILLPGADFPPRGVAFNFEFSTVPGPGLDELDFVTTVIKMMIMMIMTIIMTMMQVKRNTALQMLLSGRKDLVPHALQLLPASKVMMRMGMRI